VGKTVESSQVQELVDECEAHEATPTWQDIVGSGSESVAIVVPLKRRPAPPGILGGMDHGERLLWPSSGRG
jgi:hypothetical protein